MKITRTRWMVVIAILIAAAGFWVGMRKPFQVTGEIVCLPPADALTRDIGLCGLGLLGDNGKYYGLLSLNPAEVAQGQFAPGKRIRVLAHDAPRSASRQVKRKMDMAIQVKSWEPAP